MGRTLKDEVSSSLAGAAYFIIVEGSPDKISVIENLGKGHGSEAGEMAARSLLEERVNILVTGNIGPTTARILKEGRMVVHAGCSGRIDDAIQRCLSGKLVETEGASYSGCLESPGTAKARQ